MDKFEELAKINQITLIIHLHDLQLILRDLNEIDEIICNSKNKRFLIKNFLKNMHHNLVMIRSGNTVNDKKNYSFYEGNVAVFVFVEYLLLPLGENPTIKLFNEQLKFIVNFLNELHSPAENEYDLITREEIEDIMKLPLIQKLLPLIESEKSIKIVNFDYATTDYNSTAFYALNLIVSLRNNKELTSGTNKYQVLMHELGHLVKYNLLQDTYPNEFETLFLIAFHNDWSKINEHDKNEIFCDYFSIACSYGTKYMNDNIFIKLCGQDNAWLITLYFEKIINEKLIELLQ